MDIINEYLNDVVQAVAALPRAPIDDIVSELFAAWHRSATVFLFGNGGSSATASHMANDLNKQASAGGPRRMRALALTDNVPLITAWANDASYDDVFVEQMRNFVRDGDVAVGISTSGESRNVVNAARAAKAAGAITIGMTGPSGGTLRGVVHHWIGVPAAQVGIQEDLHLVLNHAIAMGLHKLVAAAQRQEAFVR